MIKLLNVELPLNKNISIALTNIYGIGISTSLKILNKLNINPNIKVYNLTENNIFKLNYILEKEYKLENQLKYITSLNIKHLIEINSYKGKRFKLGLPVNGQRTRTNSKTIRKLKNIILKNIKL